MNSKLLHSNNGIIYYRLKIVDKNGSVSYSPVRIIRLIQDKQGIKASSGNETAQQRFLNN